MGADGNDEQPGDDHRLVFHIGHGELVIRRRYEVVSILNDLLIGVWFVIGSILFFNEDTSRAGTWLFLIGSIQLLIRPGIRLARSVHLQRITPTQARPSTGSSFDF